MKRENAAKSVSANSGSLTQPQQVSLDSKQNKQTDDSMDWQVYKNNRKRKNSKNSSVNDENFLFHDESSQNIESHPAKKQDNNIENIYQIHKV